MSLALLGNEALRAAIRRNVVTFPAQVPALAKDQHLQARIVVLYFVRGWRLATICARYGLQKSTVRKLITDWSTRAIAAGYIQEVEPGVAAPPEADIVPPGAWRPHWDLWQPAA